MMNRHYFWAVKIPDIQKQDIEEGINQVKSEFPFQRWVHAEDYHITLAFLGAVEEQQLKLCSKLVEAEICNKKTFILSITGLDVFGKSSSPTVFWAALAFEEKLMNLQQYVYEQCINANIELDKRKFKPHITLARKWAGQEPLNIKSLSLYNPFQQPLSFQVEEVILYAVNKGERPKYEPITTIKLK